MSPSDYSNDRGNPRGPFTSGSRPPWQDRVHEAAQRIEDDVRNLVTYMNDVVVPDVRKHGSEALRVAAQELHKLAEHLDRQSQSAPPPPPPPGTPQP